MRERREEPWFGVDDMLWLELKITSDDGNGVISTGPVCLRKGDDHEEFVRVCMMRAGERARDVLHQLGLVDD